MPSETLLANLLGDNDCERTQVVLCQNDGVSHIELREQSFGEGVGWFTQSTVNLDPAQIAGLRGVLGASVQRLPVPRPQPDSQLHVLRFESA